MSISVLGIYVADLVFFGKKIPVEGETILGNNNVLNFIKIFFLNVPKNDWGCLRFSHTHL